LQCSCLISAPDHAAERTDFLIEVFSYLGEKYDFRFDFADSTRQVCTEVIYRGIQGKGGIAFDLTVRAGHETPSADDIALYYLNRHPGAFQFLLYAEQDRTGRITKRSSSTARAASSA